MTKKTGPPESDKSNVLSFPSRMRGLNGERQGLAPLVEPGQLIKLGENALKGVIGPTLSDSLEVPDSPWHDIGGGDRKAERISQLIGRIDDHILDLGMGYEVIKNKDRFGAGLLKGMTLLTQLAHSYGGDIGMFAEQAFGPTTNLRAEHENKTKAQALDLEAMRAINSLAILQNCMARVGGDNSAAEFVKDFMRQSPSSLSDDSKAEELVEEIAQDTRQLVHALGVEGPQKVQEFMDKLRYQIYNAPKLPEGRSFPSYKRMIARGDYSAAAWARFFELNSHTPTDDAA